MSGLCHNPACQEKAKVSGLCLACYARLRYWLAKKPRDIARRRQQLSRWEATLNDLMVPVRRSKQ